MLVMFVKGISPNLDTQNFANQKFRVTSPLQEYLLDKMFAKRVLELCLSQNKVMN